MSARLLSQTIGGPVVVNRVVWNSVNANYCLNVRNIPHQMMCALNQMVVEKNSNNSQMTIDMGFFQ